MEIRFGCAKNATMWVMQHQIHDSYSKLYSIVQCAFSRHIAQSNIFFNHGLIDLGHKYHGDRT